MLESETALFAVFTAVEDDTGYKKTQTGSWKRATRALERVLDSSWGESLRVKPGPGAGEILLVKILQAEAFPQLIKFLSKVDSDGEPRKLPVNHELARFNPVLDSEEVIRLQGRFRAAEGLELGLRSPALLHKEHPLTRALLLQIHQDLFHVGGHGTLLTVLKKKYWFSGAATMAKRLVRGCTICRRIHQTRGERQPDPPLPRSRIPSGSLAPFRSLAIDVGGPFLTTEGRGRALQKRYLLLFNCLHTRAVHAELLFTLEADSFLMAFSRFIALRGRPEFVLSDNGTNFVRGRKEISAAIKRARGDERFRNIRWQFIPPHSPNWNGVSERLIASAKRALKSIIGEEPRTLEELFTAFQEMAGYLNNRPLTIHSDDPNDLTPLTPNHFLLGAEYTEIGPTPVGELSLSKKWLQTQRLSDLLWQRFVDEFLPTLQGHRSWSQGGRDIQVGDVVVLLDKKVRGKWALARVEEVFPSPTDGKIRSFMVRDGETKSLFKRSLAQVYRLDLTEDSFSERGVELEDEPREVKDEELLKGRELTIRLERNPELDRLSKLISNQ